MATVTVKQLRRRVKHGAHFLDVQTPKWAHDVRLVDLKMNLYNACVLGQVYGDYEQGAEMLLLRRWVETRQDYNESRAARLGFTLVNHEMSNPRNWSRLAELWATEIAVRQLPRKG